MLQKLFNKIDPKIADWMQHYGHFLLRIALSVIFIWFGALKVYGVSPATQLVANTVYWFDPNVFVPILGYWEVLIGLGLLFRPFIRVALLLLFLQMPGTMMPLIILPDVCFIKFPFVLTMEGQYIIKNIVLVSAAIVIGGTVRAKTERWV